MSSDRITRRNQANAQKSTGPKTPDGRASTGNNARKHGATAQPDPDSVATWLAIVCDEQDIETQDLMPLDELGYRALALAEAEVQLAQCERALHEFERDAPGQPKEPSVSLDLTYKVLLENFANE